MLKRRLSTKEALVTYALAEIRRRVPASLLDEVPVRIVACGKHMGVTQVLRTDLNADGVLHPTRDGEYAIVLNNKTPSQRQRFSCAHELTHIALAPLCGDQVSFRQVAGATVTDEDRLIEQVCDAVAAELLMPEHVFKQKASALSWCVSSIQKLAQLFDTSIHATARRYVETIDEGCVLQVWRLETGQGQPKPKLVAYLKNRACKSLNFSLKHHSTGMSQALFQAFQSSSPIKAFQRVEVTDRNDQTRPETMYCEFLAYGRDHNRRVIALFYPDRKTARINGLGR